MNPATDTLDGILASLGEQVSDDSDGRCPLCAEPLPEGWDKEFMEADRKYFEEHPGATFYQRGIFPTEHPHICHGPTEFIAVWQVAPGMRIRQGRMFPTLGGEQ